MANPINLGALIADYNLDKKDLACKLFPLNMYPVPALNRVIAGKSTLNEVQIEILSHSVGVPIETLFSGQWVMRSKGFVHTFKLGDFEARLDTRTNITTLLYKEELKVKRVIHSGDIVLSDYLNKLNNLTKAFQNA